MQEKWETVNQIREFNRFYTVLLGFLNRNYLHSGYSVTETRILFELNQKESMRAADLVELLRLDKGYVSRLIRNFEGAGMLVRESAPDDGRALVIRLTGKGRRETERLIQITNEDIGKLIGRLSDETCGELRNAMRQIIGIFSENTEIQEDTDEDKQ